MASTIMIMNRRSDLLVVILCFGFCLGSVSAVPCYSYSYIEIPSASVVNNTSPSIGASNASDCQMRCFANSNCSGVAWDTTNTTNPRCYFNIAMTNSPSSGINFTKPPTSFTYFSLLRDYPSCSFQDYNCSFIWTAQRDKHWFNGVDGNRSNLNDCIKLCQDARNCTAVEWNHQDATCWTYSDPGIIPENQPNITFFTKNCTNGLPSTSKATTPGPSTTSTSTTTTTLPTTTTTTTTTLPTTTTTTMATTTTPTTKQPPSVADPNSMEVSNEFAHYPQAIRPAYIVLAGLGGGCILLVITAVVILCLYPLHKNLKYKTTRTATTTVHTHQPYVADNSYVETQEPERLDMDEMAEGDVKTYYNAEEVN